MAISSPPFLQAPTTNTGELPGSFFSEPLPKWGPNQRFLLLALLAAVPGIGTHGATCWNVCAEEAERAVATAIYSCPPAAVWPKWPHVFGPATIFSKRNCCPRALWLRSAHLGDCRLSCGAGCTWQNPRTHTALPNTPKTWQKRLNLAFSPCKGCGRIGRPSASPWMGFAQRRAAAGCILPPPPCML